MESQTMMPVIISNLLSAAAGVSGQRAPPAAYRELGLIPGRGDRQLVSGAQETLPRPLRASSPGLSLLAAASSNSSQPDMLNGP